MAALSTWARSVPRRWKVVPAIAGAIAGAYVLWVHVTSDPLADIHLYYDAASRLNAGLPLYRTGVVDPYVYPPLFAMLFRPLALLPFRAAAVAWEGAVLASFALTLWRLDLRRPLTWYAVGLLGMAIAWALVVGQAEVIVSLLLTLGNPLAVAVAGNIKLFPFLAGLYWVGRRDWRGLGRLIGWSAALGLVQLVADPADTHDYANAIATGVRQVSLPGNISPFMLSPLLWGALVALGVIATLRLGRTRWGWSAAVALSVLASPRLFIYMLTTLLACLRRPDDASSG